MGHIIALLRQAYSAVKDREVQNEVDVLLYSLLEGALVFVLGFAYYIEHKESEGR